MVPFYHDMAEKIALVEPEGEELVEIHGKLVEYVDLRLELFDLNGRRRLSLVDSRLPAGRHRFEWTEENTGQLASGVYFLRLRADAQQLHRRLVITR